MKKIWSLLLIAMLVFVMAACTANEKAGTTDKKDSKESKVTQKKVLNLNNGDVPTSFDPPKGFDSISYNALNNLMDGLLRLNEEHVPEAAIAEKWDVSDDGKVYTFHLRDAKWSNGDPVTAGDFAYAWKRMLDPKAAYPTAFLAYFIKGAEEYNAGTGKIEDIGLKAIDEKTLEVTLAQPQAYFLNVITNPAFFPVNEKVDKANPEWFNSSETYVSNGPFVLAEWDKASHFKFEKNKQYWDVKTVKLDEVNWAIVNDKNTEYQMFQNGELDKTDVPAELADQLYKEGKVQVDEQGGLYFYRLNVTQKPFQNKNIRKAFAMAINQQEIVDYVSKNKEKPAYGFVSYGLKDNEGKDFRKTNGDLLKTNIEEAKALLKKGMEEEGYTTLPPVTLTYSTSPVHQKYAETVQQMLKQNLGVDVKLANMEFNVFAEQQKALKFQFSRSSFLMDYADPINALESFQTGHSMNRTGWSNAKYDELIKNAKLEGDEAKRFAMLYEAEKILMEEAPIIPINFYNLPYILADGVSGILYHPVGYLELKWADKK
ncbi:peptide ABC transporter substrate-binding protein [Bacillus massiliigorillae]|uniref:peptide ABC transporter substrate-binding protein n=1 Tax=Bacillus massiliigorillae TaxID=1243664 RepID=UPI00039BF0A7|nr:peptide ABC transporter substrate-binding protein [Bacillus massiliigorillae]